MAERSLAATLLLLAACSGSPAPSPSADAAPVGLPPFSPPPVRKDAVVDDYHGTQVADPYRWLEDQDADEVAEFVAAQNAATRACLDAIPGRDELRARLAELYGYARHESPQRRGELWFWLQNDGLQNQPVLCASADPYGEGRVLIDPNGKSADGTVALAGLAASPSGHRLAFALSERGSDWRTWRVLDTATGEELADALPWSKFSGAAWTHDEKGFFWVRYPQPKEGETFEAQTVQPQLCYHELGTDPKSDKVVYERPDEPKWGFQPRVTDDGRFLVLTITAGTDRRNRIACIDLQEEGWPVRMLWADLEARFSFLGNDGDEFAFRTDLEAPRGRVVVLDRKAPHETLREVVPQQKAVLQDAVRTKEHFVCHYLVDAASSLRRFDAKGRDLGAVDLPALGTASGFTGRSDDEVVHFQLATFTAPSAVLRLDADGGAVRTVRAPQFRGDSKSLVTQRLYLQSKDGTRLCLFLTHRRGIRLDGSSPCLLYGYGGFGLSMSPTFRVPDFVFCERGGIYAQAVLRGGGEYGEEWHQGGMLGNKQKVFDDFVACAEFLVRNRYTSREHLAIGGGSNGGLLVGACLVQRPELFGAAVPEVGVLDMLRYHRFTIGWAWAPEYGTSDDKDAFAWLHGYSPLHNVERGTHYPPTLVMTGDHDDRVLPGHSYKFASALQAAQGRTAPILLRVETSAGHGAGKPVHKRIDEAVDRLSFLQATIGGG